MADAPYTVYQRHLQRGELAYQFSPRGQRPVFYPRAVSPYDVDETLEWRISQGRGTVYSSTAIARRDGSEYNVALIDLDEGFRLMSRVEGLPPHDVPIGLRVQFRAHPAGDTEEDPYPVFYPEGVQP
ncbi:OB-fold domain-containing protein [uncultured Xylophilus sp.]|uniref:Zn-ribbon domain-containing OB-fold protein n=1 Tax=uncultured Xylophilus sp. TaxID=296832 RepID=UPI0025F5532F|nr:OB-fold domain-containing protein [uncultured Xylophilus sp.]